MAPEVIAMLKFGAPTMVEMETLEQAAQVCAALNLDFLELNINFPQYLLPRLDADKLRAIAEKHGIFYTLHLDDEMSIADFNPYIADGYCRTVYDAIALSKALGIRKLNMHLSRGAKYTLPDRVIYFFEAYEADYLERIRAFREECQRRIGDADITICVENTAGFLPFQQKAVELLLESPVFGLTFDIGHNYCSGNMDEAFILAHKERLKHFHIHDCVEGRKDHRTLGTGVLDVKRYLDLAGELDCTAVVETKTVESLEISMGWIRRET
jgi:sugar phosphate isomerase/epimerase